MLVLDQADLTIGDIGVLQGIADKLAEALREKNRTSSAWADSADWI